MQYKVDHDLCTSQPDLVKTYQWILSEFDKMGDDKSFRKRLLDSVGGKPIRIGKAKTGVSKPIAVSFFSYRAEVDGSSFETAYANQVPEKVDGDVVEVVYDLSARVSEKCYQPVVQVSINLHRSQVK